MYQLYTWYAWQMGRWILTAEGKTIEEIRPRIPKGPGSSFKIIKDGEEIKKVINTAGFRPGMVRPE